MADSPATPELDPADLGPHGGLFHGGVGQPPFNTPCWDSAAPSTALPNPARFPLGQAGHTGLLVGQTGLGLGVGQVGYGHSPLPN